MLLERKQEQPRWFTLPGAERKPEGFCPEICCWKGNMSKGARTTVLPSSSAMCNSSSSGFWSVVFCPFPLGCACPSPYACPSRANCFGDSTGLLQQTSGGNNHMGSMEAYQVPGLHHIPGSCITISQIKPHTGGG